MHNITTKQSSMWRAGRIVDTTFAMREGVREAKRTKLLANVNKVFCRRFCVHMKAYTSILSVGHRIA